MQSPTQHLMPKIPVFNRNAGCISENCGSIYSNTPLIRALLKDGPQFKTHSAWMVTLELGILQNPGQTASLSLVPLQDCHYSQC